MLETEPPNKFMVQWCEYTEAVEAAMEVTAESNAILSECGELPADRIQLEWRLRLKVADLWGIYDEIVRCWPWMHVPASVSE